MHKFKRKVFEMKVMQQLGWGLVVMIYAHFIHFPSNQTIHSFEMASLTETESAAMEDKRLVKVTVFIKKKPDISDEEFHRYWSQRHGPLVRSIPIVQEKILKYTLYHNNTSFSSHAASLGVPVMEFDGAAEFVVTDLETLFSVWRDPEFEKWVTPDEEKFMTREGVKLMIGYEDLLMDRT